MSILSCKKIQARLRLCTSCSKHNILGDPEQQIYYSKGVRQCKTHYPRKPRTAIPKGENIQEERKMHSTIFLIFNLLSLNCVQNYFQNYPEVFYHHLSFYIGPFLNSSRHHVNYENEVLRKRRFACASFPVVSFVFQASFFKMRAYLYSS